MKIKELIDYGKKMLSENNIEDETIKSRILAEYIFNMNRTNIICNENKTVEEENKHRYYLALIELIQGMPIQYITNNQEFMKMNFYVDKNVLIPQPDTEILVEETIKIADEMKEKIDVLDICTGSGCIGISLIKNLENLNSITLSDVSEEALNVAKKNYENNIDEDIKVKFINSNMFENIKDKYNIIVSNPPYVETKEIEKLSNEVKNEPYIALDGGEDGLKFYKILINESYKFLKEDGYLCLEIGYNQKQKVEELIEQSNKYTEVYCIKDLSKNNRVVVCKKK